MLPLSPLAPGLHVYFECSDQAGDCRVRRGHSPVVLRWGYDLALHLPANIHRGLHLVHLLARSSSSGCRSCRVVHMVHATCAVARSIRPSYIAIEYCKRRADGSRKHVEPKSLILLAPQADYTPPTPHKWLPSMANLRFVSSLSRVISPVANSVGVGVAIGIVNNYTHTQIEWVREKEREIADKFD